MESHPRGIRRKALQKLAALSATSSPADFEKSDLNRLCKACPSHVRSQTSNGNGNGDRSTGSLGNQPMNLREFEVLLALCKAAPAVTSYENAAKLAYQLSPYMLEAHIQAFAPSPYFRDIEPSPIESLSFNLTTALLSLGTNHNDLKEGVSAKLWTYLDNCALTAEFVIREQDGARVDVNLEDALYVARLAISLLGYLDAAAAYAHFWSSLERLNLIKKLKGILSEAFLVAVETAFSTIRNSHSSDNLVKEWKRYYRHYSSVGRPLGAMLLQRSFVWLILATSSLLIADIDIIKGQDILELLMSKGPIIRATNSNNGDDSFAQIELIASMISDEMNLLEDGADYLRLGSVYQQRLAFTVKAAALTSYLNCSFVNEDAADVDVLMTWLEDTLADPIQMADETLASVVLRCMALAARVSSSVAPSVSRALPRFIVQSNPHPKTVSVASRSLAYVLTMLSQDSIISTLYTLGNVMSARTNTGRALNGAPNGESSGNGHVNGNGHAAARVYGNNRKVSTGSAISLPTSGEEETSIVYSNVIKAICGIARSCNDEKITSLAQSMLLQKINKTSAAVDVSIISEVAVLAMGGNPVDFRALLKLYQRLTQDGVASNDSALLTAVRKARTYLASTVSRDSAMFDIYLEHLLDVIISRGDVHQVQSRESDVEIAAREIAEVLQPLALLMSKGNLAQDDTSDDTASMIRDAWFNMVVHGFSTATPRGDKYLDELHIIAANSPPLVAEQRGEQIESDIELNTVLRRGLTPEHEGSQKRLLSNLVPAMAAEIRGFSYRKVIFLHAACLVEMLRAETGNCTKSVMYFLEPSMRSGDMSKAMEAVTKTVMDTYVRKVLTGMSPSFSAPQVAKQLVSLFCGCCHRIERVQQAAITCTDRLIRDVPSALCYKSSLFALLELLSLMWMSCLEGETDEYEWKSSFTSSRGKVTVLLSDNFALRRKTLSTLYGKARTWVSSVINIAPLDLKGLLQTYLSEYDDDGAYGHLSLGRSFASEMGSMIPVSDQKLGALDRHGEVKVNAASDFVAQYTTRQEYRYAEALPDHDAEWLRFMRVGEHSKEQGGEVEDAATVLAHLEARTAQRKFVPIGELRDVLRRAAALLCRSKDDECAIVHHLVAIPFVLFTKQPIRLGISLWLGVINENPRMESRIFMEIAQQWELTINKKLGIFSDRLVHPDPFFLKEEFAPTDKEAIAKRQQHVHNLLVPHSRLLQFLGSHFNATRLGSPDTQKTFIRILRMTLVGLVDGTGHPLAREIRFQVVLFGLRVLRYTTTLNGAAQWRLMDQILDAGLSWFAFAPQWSFGNNRLQLKADVRLLNEVSSSLRSVSFSGRSSTVPLKQLQGKEELLIALLENEQTRLNVWLHPLSTTPDGPSSVAKDTEMAVSRFVKTAWLVNPALAIGMVARFQSPKVLSEVRWLLLNFPERAVREPEALPILLGSRLQTDISSQLKYLLYWAPVNPLTAVTYFLPAYGNHPFMLQYAMRALESSSVDITFFYVPQIVQTLRYDVLGYVERYILETARFSQLFAHQIIWNMKANAYKDGDADAEVPDDLKPVLDKVMDKMIGGFSGTDKGFYEREFTFFDEVTSISGKLKPYIKKPKPEKKQKIEEELRKIKVEVGVYLPSNPDGVVIGIDRKSGKPLQSHAKAPYMATFRIRKATGGGMESTDELLEDTNRDGSAPTADTIELWQSAIFKVGDDCRQDVLVLQIIAAFRGIFNSAGLDVYLYPYRVTATAPGCGVIDVLPNSISRDMLGREAVNGLYEYFVTKYGNEDSIRFQEARNNFVKSMAAYSIICYLLQLKDRHNGNIMVDDAGHILHIDFGFCFDIVPGGVKFERAPFKLTKEMVAVMGGSTETQSYKWFEELCVKSFLIARQYQEKLSQLVLLMIDSGLPCFKPETMQHFTSRFALELTEKEAADFMRGLIKKSYLHYSTTVYDEFQRQTNSIPY